MAVEQRQIYIEKIRALPEKLESLLESLSVDQLNMPYGEGKWTIRQVVHHLADSHMIALSRMKMILTEDNPTLKPYNQDTWAELADSKLPIQISVDFLKTLHLKMAFLLDSLTEDDWKRTANHPDEGSLDMNWMVEVYAKHGEKHLGHISQIL